MGKRRILRRPSVLERVQLCRSTMYAMIAAGEFPKPIKLGPRSVGWIEEEIDAWVDDKIEERDSRLHANN